MQGPPNLNDIFYYCRQISNSSHPNVFKEKIRAMPGYKSKLRMLVLCTVNVSSFRAPSPYRKDFSYFAAPGGAN